MEVLFLAVFGFIIILRSFHTLQSVKTPKQRAGKRVHRHLLIMPKTTYCSLTWTTSPINKTKRFFKSLISFSKISFSKKFLKRIFLTVFSLYFSQGEVNPLHCPLLLVWIYKQSVIVGMFAYSFSLAPRDQTTIKSKLWMTVPYV